MPQLSYVVQGYSPVRRAFNRRWKTVLRLTLYEPDIAPNAGAMMRLCACLDVPLDIIEPCGFVLSDRKLRRAGMELGPHLGYGPRASDNMKRRSRPSPAASPRLGDVGVVRGRSWTVEAEAQP